MHSVVFNLNKKLNLKSENERIANNSNELFCKKMDFIFAYVWKGDQVQKHPMANKKPH